MDTAALVLSFLGGSAVGSVATAIYTTSHERAERFRERMLTAAEAFLVAEEQAHEAVEEALSRWRLLRQSDEALTKAQDAVAAFHDHLPDGQPEPKELEAASLLAERIISAVDAMRPVGGAVSEVSRKELATAVAAAANALERAEGEGEAADLARDLNRSLLGYAEATLRAGEEFLQAGARLGAANRIASRIRVVFADGTQDDPVTRSAFKIVDDLARVFRATPGIAYDEVAEPEEDLDQLRGTYARDVAAFAAAVNARIRKRLL
jgi:hypothetical protein